jgi:hypothetical protein
MNINIDVSLITRQIIKKNYTYSKEKQKKGKIYLYDFFSLNEIKICKKILKIPYYENNFDIIYDFDFIKVGEIKGRNIDNIDGINVKKDEKYILCQYKNEKTIFLNEYLFNSKNPKLFFSRIFDSYSYLLTSLIKLNNQNICFFDLSYENIVFPVYMKPLLKNFQNSLLFDMLDESYIVKIINNVTNFTYKPLEIHVLFYLIINNEETLSSSLIDIICDNYEKNMDVLSLFSQNYRETYKKTCIELLKKYINKPKSVIITDILKYSKYWDNYSVSMLYLYIIGNICRVFGLKDTFLNKLTSILIKNINPNPLKRETLEETCEKYNDLFDETNDWSFIKDITLKKFENLYNVLQN